MQHTAKELIERLKTEYQPDQMLAYTIYSADDVTNQDNVMPFEDAEEVWNDIIDKFDDAIDDAQSDLNQTLSELVEEALGEGEDD